MKRSLLAVALAAFFAGGVFAEAEPFRFSIGGGAMFDTANSEAEVFRHPYFFFMDTEHFGFGAWAFADAKFIELSVGVQGGILDIEIGREAGEMEYIDEINHGSFLAADINILLKYPFVFRGGDISVFPLLGAGHHFVTVANIESDSLRALSDLNAWKINFGAGCDLALRENLFFRLSALGYYRFPSNRERSFQSGMPGSNISAGGFGGALRIGFGLRL